MRLATLAALFGLALGGGAQAAVVAGLPSGGTFTEVAPSPVAAGPGNYGVELRIGGASTWEIGVGVGTSQPGYFNQADFAWNSPTTNAYTLTWTSTGVSFTVGSTTVSYAAPLLGNTLKIFAKRDADVTFSAVDGIAFNTSLNNGDAYFYSSDNWGGNGFTVTGTIRIGSANGANSASGVQFKIGDTTLAAVPVPEPATLALLGLGLAGLAAARRAGRAQGDKPHPAMRG